MPTANPKAAATTDSAPKAEVVSKFVVGFTLPNDNEEHTTIVEIPGRVSSVDKMIENAPEILRMARKNVASRFVHYEAFSNDSTYLDTLDKIADGLLVIHMGKDGDVQRFLVEGSYSNYPEGGVWGDWVTAVDHEDALFQAKWQMADNEDEDPNEDFDSFLATMDEINVFDCAPDPVTKDELSDRLRDLVIAAKEAGVEGEAMLLAEEALTLLGKPIPASGSPKP